MPSRLLRIIGWALWAALVYSALSEPARAWGPGAHVDAAWYLLKNLALLAPVARKIISSHPFAFIYGSVAPDMVLGKRFMNPAHNNHNWEVGFRIKESARTQRQKAFALGYLSHLAADTVAHNQYVPERLIEHYHRRRRGHLVQELMFEASLDPETWKLARAATRRPYSECDELFSRHVAHTPLPDGFNRRMFRSGLWIVRLGLWERVVRIVRKRFAPELDGDSMAAYSEAIRTAVLDLMNDLDSAPCLSCEPTGGSVLPEAENLKRALKRMRKRAHIDKTEHLSITDSFRQWRDREEMAWGPRLGA